MIKNNHYNLYLIITIFAFVSGLSWLFLGESIIDLFVSRGYGQLTYAFMSGIMLMIVLLGVHTMVKIVLNYTGWIADDETIQLAIYQNIAVEEADGVFFKDRRGYYRLMNDTARKLLDLEINNPIGQKDYQIFDSILAHKIENEDKKVMQFNESFIWEIEKDTGNGREVWLCKKMPCRNRKGQLLGIVGYCRNITVLKTFQNLNTALEQRFQNLFDKLPYPVLVMDALNLKPYSFNRSMTTLLGYSTHEFADMRFNVHLSEDDSEVFISTIRRLIDASGGEFKAKLCTRDKVEVDVSGYVQTLIIDDRKYLHMLLHDVTDLLQSTEELISSEMKYRSLFEHASDAILIIDIKTLQIIDANDVAIHSLGYRRSDLMQLTLLELESKGEQLDTSEQLSNLEIYNHVTYEHVIRDRKGQAIQVEINAHKVNYGTNQVYQFVIRDIGLRRKTEQALKESEQRYRQMFENNQAIKLVIDVDNYKIEDANLAAAKFYGYSQSEMPGMNLDKINIMSRDKILNLISQSKEQNLGYYTCPHRLASGDVRFVEVRDGIMEIGGQSLLYSIIYDVTETRHVENQLLLASKMFDCTTDAVMITDKNNQIVSINQAFSELTGFQLSEIINTGGDNLLAGRDQKFITREVVTAVLQHGSWHGEVWVKLLNGETSNKQATINVVIDQQGEILNHIIMISTNQDDIRIHNKPDNYASLTGLPTRTIFNGQLKQAIDRCQRSHKQVAILLLDVRNFSDINRSRGREAGDQILKAMARRLKHNVRESDTVAHFEKDNFAVLLEDLADVQQTGIVAQKILSTLGEDYQIDGYVVSLEISIGISVAPEDGIDEAELLSKAEYALVAAQQIPGSSFRLRSQHMHNSAWQWLQTDENLHRALKNNEFIVSYLPQVSLMDNRVEAMEALVRWNTPHGVLLPLRFLPNAEQSGFISAIGNKVIEMACHDFGVWRQQGINLDYLFINLSLAQIVEELEVYLLEQCKNNNISPEDIVLDFDEQRFVVSSTEQRNILRSLQSKGFRICVDDFGSGAASLSCLLQCPVDVIKVDRAFTSTCSESMESKNMLLGVLALAEKLQMTVVAEGVESITEYEQLRELGCRHMQGYYFSEPLNFSQVKNYVNEFEITMGDK